MKSKIKLALFVFKLIRQEIYKSRYYLVLLSLIPLSEIKAIFYESDLRVSWFLFSDNKILMCNVLERYSNIIIIGTFIHYYLFVKRDMMINQIMLFLYIINAYDLLFLGLMDNAHYLWKLPLTALTYSYANSKITFQRI
jgi:hypothetical protein